MGKGYSDPKKYWWVIPEGQWDTRDFDSALKLSCPCSPTTQLFDEQEMRLSCDEGSFGIQDKIAYFYSCSNCGKVQIFDRKLVEVGRESRYDDDESDDD